MYACEAILTGLLNVLVSSCNCMTDCITGDVWQVWLDGAGRRCTFAAGPRR